MALDQMNPAMDAALEQAPSAEDRRRLRRLPLFGGGSDATIHDLIGRAPITVVPRHQLAMRENTTAGSLVAVVAGRLALMAQMPGEQSEVISIVERGELLMPGAAIAALPYPLTARAVEDSRIASFALADIWAAADRDSRFAVDLARLACHEWHGAVMRLKDFRLRSAPQRLAAYLVNRATAAGKQRTGTAELELADDRKTLASLLGMTPENLSRTIAQFRDRGVAISGRLVTITDLVSLADFAHSEPTR
jgi:CRP/FNR family transcriptional activator FtrB